VGNQDPINRPEAVFGGGRDGRSAGDHGTRARVVRPPRTRVFTMLRRTMRGHRRRRVGGKAVKAGTHRGLHVRHGEHAKDLTEDRPNVKCEHDRSGSVEWGFGYEDHLGRRDDTVGTHN